MQNVQTNWDEIAAHLEPLQAGKFKPATALKKFYQEGHGRPGLHFFQIRYEPGEVLMAKGTYSDYAAFHLSGRIAVQDETPGSVERPPSCWSRPGPWRRRLEGWVLDRSRRLGTEVHPHFRPGGGPPRSSRLTRWVAGRLAGPLGLTRRREEGTLARPNPIASLDVPSVDPLAGAIGLVAEPTPGSPPGPRLMGVTSVLWNQPRSVTLLAADRVELLLIKRKALLEILKGRPDLFEEKTADFVRHVLPRRLAANRLFRGLGDQVDFERVRDLIVEGAEGHGPLLLQKYERRRGEAREETTIYERGSPSDSLYFILSGNAVVKRDGPGGTMLLNHLGDDGYFGESCLEAGASRSATVETLGRVYALKIDREVVLKIVEEFPAIGERLRSERERMRRRDEDIESGRRPPPRDPPQEVASKLMLATNLLLIDMDRCTRCDQCVRACADAHEGVPRFHRASPDPELRFGRWEVAGACVHCRDAPCQEACPVGAITILDGAAVHIHRNRCIGCALCPPACPFDVIDMYPPVTPEEAVSLKVVEGDGHASAGLATKCDLCLTPDRDPPCVAACPYDAAHRGAPEVLFPALKGFAIRGAS